jgi:hypothetical protein
MAIAASVSISANCRRSSEQGERREQRCSFHMTHQVLRSLRRYNGTFDAGLPQDFMQIVNL